MSELRAPTKHDVRDLLANLLVDVGGIGPDVILDDATVDGELRLESVVFVEIQVALEEALDIEIDLLDVVELNEFGAIVDYLYGRTLREGSRGAGDS